MIKDGVLTYHLLEHQKEAVEKNDINFINHNVTGTVMPTGTGKSFVAMAHMISANNPRYKGVNENGDIVLELGPNGVVNDSKIIYVAPNNEIAAQIKIDIVEYILGIDLEKEYGHLKESLGEDEYRKFIINKRNELVKTAFPNLEFVCYKTLYAGIHRHEEGREGFDPYEVEPDLVIGDEIHRSGAPTYQEGMAALMGGYINEDGEVVRSTDPAIIKKKGKIKLLTISATPERDVDGRDMTKVWARAFGDYTEEELSDDVRADLGLKMTLPDAINRGILKNPNVVYFDCNLVNNEDYQVLVRQATSVTNDPKIREEARKSLEVVNEQVIGIKDFHLLNSTAQEAALQEKQIEIYTDAIKKGLFNLDGKFILFAPHTQNEENGTPITRAQFLEEHAKKTTDILEEAIKRAGVEARIKVDYITSDNDDITNEGILTDFNSKKVGESGNNEIHIVVAQEKFNEGVHAKKITGGFNTRKITEQQNTNLRAQSILFLQTKGRFDFPIIPGVETPPTPTIFDVCNNFYIQNVNGAVDPSQVIDIFKLTPTQKILHDEACKVRNMINAEKANIVDILPRLLSITEVLKRHGINVNHDNIKSSGLLSLLKKKKYDSVREGTLKELEELQLISKNDKGYMEYPLGKVLSKARKSYWSGTKEFGKYSFSEMLDAGIVDKTSPEYKDAIKKGYINDDGFVVMNVTEEHLFHNVETGTKFSKKDRDIDGFFDGQFDVDTGLDAEKYNRRGFNDKGLNKVTGTIHDTRGFMADGTNILTGTEYDLNGYNWDGIKPFYNKDGKLVGGFDKERCFHSYDEETRQFSKVKLGKYAPYDSKTNVDCYYFDSKKPRNVKNNGAATNYHGFSKERIYERNRHYIDEEEPEKAYFDDNGYDIDRFDIHSFTSGFPARYERVDDLDNPTKPIYTSVKQLPINKETGTRLNPSGNSQLLFSVQYTKLQEFIRKQYGDLSIGVDGKGRQYFKVISDYGKRLLGRPDSEKIPHVQYIYMGFSPSGINSHTGLMTDIYGFTLQDYMANPKIRGFNPRDVLKLSRASSEKLLYPNSNKNILGTDKAGRISGGKIDPSLVVAKDFVEKCIKGNMSEEEYLTEYAKKNRLLLYNPVPGRPSEAKFSLRANLSRAFELYRLCPELAKSKEAKDVMSMIYSSSPKKLNQLLVPYVQNMKNKVKFDYLKLQALVKKLDNPQKPNIKLSRDLQDKVADAEKFNRILNDDLGGK